MHAVLQKCIWLLFSFSKVSSFLAVMIIWKYLKPEFVDSSIFLFRSVDASSSSFDTSQQLETSVMIVSIEHWKGLLAMRCTKSPIDWRSHRLTSYSVHTTRPCQSWINSYLTTLFINLSLFLLWSKMKWVQKASFKWNRRALIFHQNH